jgi:lipopolysaccharide assembly outer membrane protein LptD (OstA)
VIGRRSLIAVFFLVPVAAHAQAILSLDQGGFATITADEMSGSQLHTEYEGSVVAHRGTQSLFADRVVMDFHEEGGKRVLTKATADGDVLLIDGTMVAACQHMELDSDLVRGMLETAEIHVKRPGVMLPGDFSALTAGRDSVYISGNIERLGPKKFRIRNVYFTPCDCGKSARLFPSAPSRASSKLAAMRIFICRYCSRSTSPCHSPLRSPAWCSRCRKEKAAL